MSAYVNAALLDSEEAEVAQALHVELGTEAGSDELKLSASDVLTVLSAQVVLPILSSFVSAALWERYNNIRTARAISDARKDLEGQPLNNPPAVERDVVERRVRDALEAEGVPSDQAERAVAMAYTRLSQAAATP